MSHAEYHNNKLVTTANVEFTQGNLRDQFIIYINSSFDALYLKGVIEDTLDQLGYKERK